MNLQSRPCYVCLFGVGIVTVFLGQFLRSAAMIKAASNFSHVVAFRRNVGHRLVTDGIYTLAISLALLRRPSNATSRWFRHPSYAGFFYWALGTQLVLQNPLSFCVYIVLLMRFFSSRIKGASYPLSNVALHTECHCSRRTRLGQFLWG